MKQNAIVKLTVAGALLFVVNLNANAQLGGLLNKAKKAVTKEVTKEVVKDANMNGNQSVGQSASQTAMEAQVMADYTASHPQVQERNAIQAAGGMDKYLGLDKTENGRILWKYGRMEQDDWTTSQIKSAWSAARYVIQVLRYLKGNTETFASYKDTNYVLTIFNTDIPDDLKRAGEKSKTSAAVSANDIAAIRAEADRVKKMYKERTGATEKSAEEKKAEAEAAYVQEIINKNYLLDDLTDKNRQAKTVADYKTKVNAKIKQQLAPTKILGTYSTSFAWQGLPLQNYPDLKEKYESVQEMQFKTFYQKGGKYYVVKSAFRQSIPKGDNASGAKPQTFYWPGVETPIEIPADKIQGKF
jgi:hypothetical protein